MDLEALKRRLEGATAVRTVGRVESVTGLSVRVRLPAVRIGDVVTIHRKGEPLLAEVVGFDGGLAVTMPLGPLLGIGVDDEVESQGGPFVARASEGLIGRVLDGLGRPLDGGAPIEGGVPIAIDRAPPSPTARRAISRPMTTHVRVLDGLLTMGEGQRVGLFAGSGVGKSTLLGSIARRADADVVVVALVGERGREVSEFLEHALGDEGRRRSIVVAATSDVAPLERLRAAELATAYAEHFRDEGRRVLLLVDSVTRFARAQREIGLAAGEAPARRGYPPSVFARLPRLLERAGQGERGSITAIYTVLVEGGDMDEPIADEVRGILDGHVVLDRALVARGRFPAVDVLHSVSRVMDSVTTPSHRDAARKVRALLGAYEEKRDLVLLGAYAKGGDKLLDEAIRKLPEIERFLGQAPDDATPFAETLSRLSSLASS